MLTKNNTLYFTLFIFVSLCTQIFAQRTIEIQPGFGTLGTTILGDTTSTGERTDPNTVYILQRDGLYILDGEFSPEFDVVIQAADGTGERPKIILGVPTGGSTPAQAIRPRANFTAKGLYISAIDELGGMGSRIIRHEENDIRVILDDCHLDICGQAIFRVNTNGTKTYLINSIISNVGTMASPDNGRCFDDRGNDIDTLYIENCTFYNMTSQVLRDAGGRINYAYVNHNTFCNIGGAGDASQNTLEFGDVSELVVTNNLFKDANLLGTSGEVGAVIQAKPATDESITQSIIIKNNNIFWTEELVSNYPDSVVVSTPFDSLTSVFIAANGDEASNISEYLDFVDEPAVGTESMLAFWNDADHVELDTDGYLNFDFAYSKSAVSYSASTSAQPLGALTWFNMEIITDVNDENQVLPNEFNLSQNYPNPFNPTTMIEFSIPNAGAVSLKIHNVLGQEITTLVNKELQAGTYRYSFNAINLSSGIYFYSIKTANNVATKKMMLIK